MNISQSHLLQAHLSQAPIPRSFYQRDTLLVARELLGALLVREYNGQQLVGIISETEAYGGSNDAASHCYKKKSERNSAMFGPVGHTYIYFIYGIHYNLNIVAKSSDTPAGGVLIRGIIPVAGQNIMHALRGAVPAAQLTNGPGKLCQALSIGRAYNHHDVTKQGELYLLPGTPVPDQDVVQTPRIGISKAQDLLWRFVFKNK